MPKHRKRKNSSSDDSSSSDGFTWEECTKTSQNVSQGSYTSKNECLDTLFDTFTAKRQKEKDVNARLNTEVRAASIELNPYWKDGGSGLPMNRDQSQEKQSQLNKSNEAWLKMSYKRCLERSLETNTDIKSLLLERWDEKTVEDILNTFGKGDRGKSYSAFCQRKDNSENNAPRWKKSKINEAILENSRDPRSSEHIEEDKSSKNEPVVQLSVERGTFEERMVTQDDINAMAAKLLRAELESNSTKVNKLKENLEKLREAMRRGIKVRLHSINKNLNKSSMNTSQNTNTSGYSNIAKSNNVKSSRTHNDEIYNMIKEEKLYSATDMNLEFSRIASNVVHSSDDECIDLAENKRKRGKTSGTFKQLTHLDLKRRVYEKQSTCSVCIEQIPNHLVVSVGEKIFLSLPKHESFVEAYCLLTPCEHIGAVTGLDLDTIEELRYFKTQLQSMYLSKLNNSGCVFIETVLRPDSAKHHTQIECIPIPENVYSLLPGYFKKALTDLGSEWSQHRHVISLKPGGSGAYRSIPSKFAYISVEFGVNDGGFARVIDDTRKIHHSFGREVISGMLMNESNNWRKPQTDSLNFSCKKVVDFENLWHSFDKWKDNKPVLTTAADKFVSGTEGPELPPSFVS